MDGSRPRTTPRLAALLAIALLALAAGPAAARAAELRVPYTTFTLPNGLKVILHEDHSLPIVTVNTWYHVGSGDEKPGRTGFAHLFEHLMFMGSQHVPTGEFDQLLEAAGARQQRLDHRGPHQLLRGRSRERPPADALPRLGPHGLPAARDDRREGGPAARRGEERAAAELREPALRARRARTSSSGSTRPRIPTRGR